MVGAAHGHAVKLADGEERLVSRGLLPSGFGLRSAIKRHCFHSALLSR
jgi:hypothetical protein